jgi:type II secretory pathway predicted ATPase ExeA
MKDGQIQTELGTANHLRTLFKPGTWLTKIDFINHLVLFNNVLITVLSEQSGGKTSFSSLLLNNLDAQIKPVFTATQTPCDRADVLADLASQLHLNVDAQTNVSSLVAQINERKAPVLFIIDDAHHLPEDLIKDFLIEIRKQDDTGFFHLCLVSDYSVVATLNNLAADQFNNLVHTIELGDLTESETRTYVLQRAMVARLINKPLADNQLRQFYLQTKGNIARINSNLESFVFKCATQKARDKGFIAKRASLAASIVAVAGISAFYYFNHDVDKTVGVEPVLVSSMPSLQDTMTHTGTLAHNELLPSYIPGLRVSSTVQLVQNELPKKQILDIPEEEQTVNPIALVDKVVVLPTISHSELVKETVITTKSTVQVQKAEPLAVKVASKDVIKPAKQEKTVAKVAQLAGFTIQLVASHNKNDVYRFQQTNKLADSTKIRQFTNAKGNWYILTVGDFNSRAQAQEKASNLPASIAKLKPWIRPVSGLTQAG